MVDLPDQELETIKRALERLETGQSAIADTISLTSRQMLILRDQMRFQRDQMRFLREKVDRIESRMATIDHVAALEKVLAGHTDALDVLSQWVEEQASTPR